MTCLQHSPLSCSAELGIDIPGILKRSTCIASSRTRNLDLEGLDLGGPLIFVLLLACIHLLVSAQPNAVQHGVCYFTVHPLHTMLLQFHVLIAMDDMQLIVLDSTGVSEFAESDLGIVVLTYAAIMLMRLMRVDHVDGKHAVNGLR